MVCCLEWNWGFSVGRGDAKGRMGLDAGITDVSGQTEVAAGTGTILRPRKKVLFPRYDAFAGRNRVREGKQFLSVGVAHGHRSRLCELVGLLSGIRA